MAKTGGLGRGMDAILGGGSISTSFEDVKADGATTLREIDIDKIEPNPDQPRKDFDGEKMIELTNSIKQIGIITPITLRKINDDKYQIVAGERRWRASQMAGLKKIPAYIREGNETEMAEMALIENIQRSDLNAIEIALSYKSLMEKGNYTQEQLSERVGKNRTTVSNYLRLLGLPSEIVQGIQNHDIENGHARALLGLESIEDQLKLYKKIVSEALSVRKVEELVRAIKQQAEATDKPATTPTLPEEYTMMAELLGERFSTKVDINRNAKGKGKISISFGSDEEFEKIVSIFDQLPSKQN